MFSDKFGRLITAMITPFSSKTEEREVDFEALEKLIEHLIKTGSTSLLITGTTGENPTLSHEEEWQLLKRTKEIVNNRVPVIFGSGSNSTKTTIETSKKAVELGADAVMLVSPYYNKPSQEGLFSHFAKVAEAVDVSILLYNNPGRTCSYIQASTIAMLNQKYPNIKAIKESRSENALDTITQLRIIAPNVEIYSGDDSMILPVLALGGVGIVSVASHITGLQITEMMNEFLSGRYERAEKIFNTFYPLFRGLFTAPSPAPVKYLLSELNICDESVRLPLTEAPENVKQSLKEIFSEVTGIKC